MAAWDTAQLQGPPQAPSYQAPQVGVQLGQLLGGLPQDYQDAQLRAGAQQLQQADLAQRLLQLQGLQRYAAMQQQQAGGQQGTPDQAQVGAAVPSAAAGGSDVASLLKHATWGQESDYGRNTKTSQTGNIGDMQISQKLFDQYAQSGEDIHEKKDNLAVGGRILDDYLKKYNGDWRRAAVAYYSGEGNVAPPGSSTPWKVDRSPRPGVAGPSTSGYVQQIGQKMALANRNPQVASADPNFMPQGQGRQPQAASAESAQQTGPSTTRVAQAGGEPEDNPRVRALDKRIEDETNRAAKLAPYTALVPQAKADMENAMQQAKLLQDRRQQLVERLGGERKMQLETEETRKRGEQASDTATYSKQYDETQKQGDEASKAAQTLHLAQAFMNDPSFDSGTFATNKLAYKRFMTAIGKGDSSQALTQEGFKKATSEAILEQLKSLGGLGLGQVKAKEFETMQKAAQSDENTPATNRLLTEMGLRMAERWQIPLAQQAREYRASHGGHLDAGWDAEKAKYVEGTPLFSPDELSDVRRIAPISARTPQEAARKGWHEGEPLRVPDPNTGRTRIITHLQGGAPTQGGGPMIAPAQQER